MASCCSGCVGVPSAASEVRRGASCNLGAGQGLAITLRHSQQLVLELFDLSRGVDTTIVDDQCSFYICGKVLLAVLFVLVLVLVLVVVVLVLVLVLVMLFVLVVLVVLLPVWRANRVKPLLNIPELSLCP